jgi:hypothetical protein
MAAAGGEESKAILDAAVATLKAQGAEIFRSGRACRARRITRRTS